MDLPQRLAFVAAFLRPSQCAARSSRTRALQGKTASSLPYSPLLSLAFPIGIHRLQQVASFPPPTTPHAPLGPDTPLHRYLAPERDAESRQDQERGFGQSTPRAESPRDGSLRLSAVAHRAAAAAAWFCRFHSGPPAPRACPP